MTVKDGTTLFTLAPFTRANRGMFLHTQLRRLLPLCSSKKNKPIPVWLQRVRRLTMLMVCLVGCGWGIWWLLPACPHPLEGVPFSHVVLNRNGDMLRLSLAADQTFRVRVRLTDIPAHAVQATLAYEDRFFWQHYGVNPLSLVRAAWHMTFGGRRMGGSTLTMQVARLRYGLNTTSLSGKMLQMFRAVQLERHFGKDTILEAYFNLAPYGGNVEGLGAAARVYFHTTASRLTPLESAALAVVPQNPNKRRPATNNPAFTAARALSASRAGQAPHSGATALAPLRVFAPKDLPFEAPHLCSELLSPPSSAKASSTDIPSEQRTTIDPLPQRHIEDLLQRFALRYRPYDVNNAAALLVHWPSMEVRALAGSVDFHNPAIAGQIDGTRALRSPGSTLKPFIYALALEQKHIHPRTLLADTPQSFGGYDPENFDKGFRGPLHADEALRLSRNIPAIRLASQLKDPDLYSFLQDAGINLPFDREHYGLSLVLGSAELSMRDLAKLYAMLANQGVLNALRFTLDSPVSEPSRQYLSPEAAFVTLSMLEDANPDTRVRTRRGESLPVRLKTGTSNGFRDAWTVGIAGPYVLAVWVGHFNNTPNPLFVGGETALPLFMDILRGLMLQTPPDEAAQAEQSLSVPQPKLNVIQIPSCLATGDLDTTLCEETLNGWFIPGISPVRSSGIYRKIMVDTHSNLRLCTPKEGRTAWRVAEFWPGDLARLFARAGMIKPTPPAYAPECLDGRPLPGYPPHITYPKDGVTYYVPRGTHTGTASIPLMADADADANTLFWFANDAYIGRSASGSILVWKAAPGRFVLRVTDDLGRAARRIVQVFAGE